MIEIRRIREYTIKGKTKKADKPFEPEIYTEYISNLFNQNISSIISKIPEPERYNCYYTLGHAPAAKDTKSRKWSHQEVIPFDIDNCEYIGDSPNPKYLEVIASVLQVDIEKCVVIATGNGLQVLVKPRDIINDPKFFENNSKFYSALCQKVVEGLKASSLKGEPDVSAFQPNRLFRLPLTFNVKPNRPKRLAQILKGQLETVDFDLAKASGLPAVLPTDAISEKELTYFKIDTHAVLTGCDFLKYAKDNQKSLQEPQWYAILSLLGRLDQGSTLAHLYSKDHPNYSPHETDLKLKQSLDASGPRTCENINTLWGKCRECPNFKRVNSPVAIRSPGFIATEESGFHLMSKKGALVPQYDDLRRHYENESNYVNYYGSHFIFDGKSFYDKPVEFIPAFAESKFKPSCDNNKALEFRGKVMRTNIVDTNFFSDTTNRRINLRNGVLNIDTMTLSPHSAKYGFKYCLDFDYDPIAEAPLFTKFLTDVTCSDEPLQKILVEYMGYALSGDEPLTQKFMLLTGEGSNGKSTFLKILKSIGGNGARAMTEENLMNQFDVIGVDGATFVIIEEVPSYIEAKFWERLKNLVSGGSVRASKKGKDAYEFNCKAKFILTSNSMPKGANPNHGLFRRFLIIPFKAKFDSSVEGFDRKIADKIIAAELPGVLNMALDAYHRLKDNDYDFTPSLASENAKTEFIEGLDSVTEWAELHLMADLKATVTSRELYSSYVSFIEASGEKPVSAKSLTIRLKAWIERNKIKAEYSRTESARIFKGILLKKSTPF